jgi:hypothetical protein
MARRARRMRSIKQQGDLIWITSVIAAVLLENTATVLSQIVIPSDWSANTGFDRCTLMRIRGWLSVVQSGAATAATPTAFYMAMLTKGINDADVPNPADAQIYSDYDTIWNDGMGLTAAVSSTQLSQRGSQLDIKSKRRLTSGTDLSLVGFLVPDAATPRVEITGVVRALIKVQ